MQLAGKLGGVVGVSAARRLRSGAGRSRSPLTAVSAGLIVGLATLVAGCGSTAKPSASTTVSTNTTSAGLRVSPAAPGPRSQVSFGFTAPVASGSNGTTEISYSLSVTGPMARGCAGTHEAAAPGRTAKGQSVRIVVGPAQLGASWCPGHYTARVFQLARAACHTGQACPQYIRVVGVVGKSTFDVAKS